MKTDHIGYLVKNIEKSVKYFSDLGFQKEGEVVYDPLRDIDILFMTNDGYRVELVAPRSENSVVNSLYKKIGTSPYHICYCCDDIEEARNELREKGFVPVNESMPAVAFGNRNVCFLFNRNVGIIELVENQ